MIRFATWPTQLDEAVAQEDAVDDPRDDDPLADSAIKHPLPL